MILEGLDEVPPSTEQQYGTTEAGKNILSNRTSKLTLYVREFIGASGSVGQKFKVLTTFSGNFYLSLTTRTVRFRPILTPSSFSWYYVVRYESKLANGCQVNSYIRSPNGRFTQERASILWKNMLMI